MATPDNLRDEVLVDIARAQFFPGASLVTDMAAEMLRMRRLLRADTRRAQQVRRLRWTAENLLVKVENLLANEREIAAAGEDRSGHHLMVAHLVAEVSILGERVAKIEEDDRG